MDVGQNITFNDFLNILQMDKQTYIFTLRSRLQKPTIFLKWNPNDIRTNAYKRFVVKLWQANINAQLILDPYVATSYCTSYLTKVNKNVTQGLHTMVEKCEVENEEVFQCIWQMGNVFLNAQQMST
jgi:hypothetical protein